MSRAAASSSPVKLGTFDQPRRGLDEPVAVDAHHAS